MPQQPGDAVRAGALWQWRGDWIGGDVPAHRAPTRLADQNCARLRNLLQQVGDLHCLADGGVLDVAIISQTTDHQRSRVDAHLQMEIFLADRVRWRHMSKTRLQGKRGEYRPAGVVFVHGRRPEDGDEPIGVPLTDHALVPADLVRREREELAHHLVHTRRPETLDDGRSGSQRGGPDKKHGTDILQPGVERFGDSQVARHDLDSRRQPRRRRPARERTHC